VTPNERREVLEAIHSLEIQFTDRMARIETKMDKYRELDHRVELIDRKLDAESTIMRDRSNRLLIGLTIVSLLALGDIGATVAPIIL